MGNNKRESDAANKLLSNYARSISRRETQKFGAIFTFLQRSRGKVMFSQACVCPHTRCVCLVHGSRSLLGDWYSWRVYSGGVDTQGGEYVRRGGYAGGEYFGVGTEKKVRTQG